ncbi:uncharacterized protein TRAVEDRAFT_37080 [Trametes versicolor FP-101664 SS1]|uniref:uncharacterized protein n=1 Tax=Trametes versicolor (strain FP-101664) TaxID=717944 RepID=UPI0004622B4B|nr:uncharacterized protein TRAVEDRAFT_37080 [Trametes versicolor FP-101664 SS1]EIW59813.1 hypothetical protein TRAVEDRAFT_37080 [Trametes versicolor FP-101664 SS1]
MQPPLSQCPALDVSGWNVSGGPRYHVDRLKTYAPLCRSPPILRRCKPGPQEP